MATVTPPDNDLPPDAQTREALTGSASATEASRGGRFVWISALSLYATTLLTSALGFVYWMAAAHFFAQSDVGIATTLMSAVQTLAAIAVFGVSTLVLGELATGPRNAAAIVRIGVGAVSVLGAIVGAIAVLALPLVDHSVRAWLAHFAHIVLFITSVAVCTAFLVVDDAAVGAGRGGAQLTRNAIFAVSKAALLVVFGLGLAHDASTAVLLSWTVGNLLSIPAIAFLFRRDPSRGEGGHDDSVREVVTRHSGKAMVHHWLNVALQVPKMLLPVVAAAVLGTRESALLYTALMLVAFLLMIPAHFSTALFALPRDDFANFAKQGRSSLRVCSLLSVLAIPGTAIFGGWALHLFGSEYVSAANAMTVLAATMLPWTIKSMFVAVSRFTDQLSSAAAWATIGAGAELGTAVVGALIGERLDAGLVGLAVGFLVGLTIESLIFSPRIIRALRRPPAGDAERGQVKTGS